VSASVSVVAEGSCLYSNSFNLLAVSTDADCQRVVENWYFLPLIFTLAGNNATSLKE
jgi:hypothetical protein